MKTQPSVALMQQATPILLLFSLLLGADAALAQAADITTEIGGQFKTYLTLAVQVLSAIAFVIVGYGVLVKFLDAIANRSTWGEVIMPVLFGGVLLLVTAFMFTQAQTFIDTIA